MDYLAGIDLGSTTLKCVIYDLDGNVVASGSITLTRIIPNGQCGSRNKFGAEQPRP